MQITRNYAQLTTQMTLHYAFRLTNEKLHKICKTQDLNIFFFFQYLLMSNKVAGAAAQDWAATHHSLPPPPTFRLAEAQSGSILNP